MKQVGGNVLRIEAEALRALANRALELRGKRGL
jgi:hypothetical protein